MATFFTAGEQIEFTFTSYGKKMLSQGKFSPKYYSFHDDSVLYSSGSETSKQSVERILQNTSYLKNTHLSGSNIYTESDPLGSSAKGVEYNSPWKINFNNTKVVKVFTQNYNGNSLSDHLSINLDVEHRIVEKDIGDITEAVSPDGLQSLNAFYSSPTDQGTYWEFIPDDIVIEFSERNADAEGSLYELEIYKIEGDREILLRQMPIFSEQSRIVDGFLVEGKVDEFLQRQYNLVSNKLEDHFIVQIDENIDMSITSKLNISTETPAVEMADRNSSNGTLDAVVLYGENLTGPFGENC